MRRRTRALNAIVLAFFFPLCSYADDLAFVRNARTYETQQSSLVTKAMAHACLATTMITDSIPCNPAMMPYNTKAHLGVEGLLSNGYPTLEKMRKLLSGEVDSDLVTALFSDQRILQIEGNAEIAFVSQYLNAKYTPINAKFFSVVRNEANPDVDLYGVEEKNFVFQTGAMLTQGLSAGVQLRSVQRKYVRKRFQLLSLATQEGKDLLKPKDQTAIFIEPGVAYAFQAPWKPRLALFVANLGYNQNPDPDLPNPVDIQGGLTVSPPVRWGELEFGLDYRSMNYEEEATEKFRLATAYRLGGMTLAGGIDIDGGSLGAYYGIEQVNAGILFSTTQVPWRQNDYYAQTVYLQVGWQI